MKVVCINPSGTKMLRMGATYTVIGDHPGCICKGPAYYLAEAGRFYPAPVSRRLKCICKECETVMNPVPWKTIYAQSRFIPLDPPKQDAIKREREVDIV